MNVKYKLTLDEIRQMQSLPLEAKVIKTQLRIREFYDYFNGQVYVSFSGGKDSTVLLDIARSMYKGLSAIFVDTGLEFPEVRDFAMNTHSVITIKPRYNFQEVIYKWGYPVVSKIVADQIQVLQNPTEGNAATRRLRLEGIRKDGSAVSRTSRSKLAKKWYYLIDAPFKISGYCCDVMKKQPLTQARKIFEREPIIGTMASDSRQREFAYLQVGCNTFEGRHPHSSPMSFWTEQDIWDYIHSRNLPYCSIYDAGYERTGCMFCAFGVFMEDSSNRFERMRVTHPKQYKFCMEKLGMAEVLDFIGIPK